MQVGKRGMESLSRSEEGNQGGRIHLLSVPWKFNEHETWALLGVKSQMVYTYNPLYNNAMLF
jgi:hypothetical protein